MFTPFPSKRLASPEKMSLDTDIWGFPTEEQLAICSPGGKAQKSTDTTSMCWCEVNIIMLYSYMSRHSRISGIWGKPANAEKRSSEERGNQGAEENFRGIIMIIFQKMR